jgi:hypothetical protein
VAAGSLMPSFAMQTTLSVVASSVLMLAVVNAKCLVGLVPPRKHAGGEGLSFDAGVVRSSTWSFALKLAASVVPIRSGIGAVSSVTFPVGGVKGLRCVCRLAHAVSLRPTWSSAPTWGKCAEAIL